MALLGGPQRGANVDSRRDVWREQLDVAVLDVEERVLAVPQRVVGIDAKYVEAALRHRVIALR